MDPETEKVEDGKVKNVSRTLRLPKNIAETIDVAAAQATIDRESRVSRNDLVQEALTEYYEKHEIKIVNK